MDKNTTFFLIAQKKRQKRHSKNAPAITIAVSKSCRQFFLLVFFRSFLLTTKRNEPILRFSERKRKRVFDLPSVSKIKN